VGVPLKEIALSGGGATTPGWPQIIADVCQYPVAVYSDQDTVTHGLYAYACQVMQDGVTFEQALQRTFHQAAWVTPNAECADLYSQLFESYVLMADFADQALSKR
jgi:L-xylulokinase